MILTDTGPLLALLDRDDRHHQACLDALNILPAEPMLTTWPCFTEAIYLLGTIEGYASQEPLWKMYAAKRLIIHALSSAEIERMHELMATYRDTPMDLADASLVSVAESLGHRRVFSLDSHFYIYRLSNGNVLQVVP